MGTIKWSRVDNATGTNTLKQHAFKAVIKRRWPTLEPFDGNKSLCGLIAVTNCDSINGSEVSCTIDEVEAEDLNETLACRHCVQKFNNLSK